MVLVHMGPTTIPTRSWAPGLGGGISRPRSVAETGIGWPATEMFQMPRIFLTLHGQVLRSFVHQSAADSPHCGKLVELDGVGTDSAVAS
jgi:hypothetical protein